MIAFLEGTLHDKAPDHVVVVASGVGYRVNIPVSTYYELPAEGETLELRIHTHVREDTLSLYGFSSKREQILFDRLIGVAGVGPSLALKVMSGLEPDALITALRQGDKRRLNAIPGVGTKTAERLILELRDKMPALAAAAPPAGEPAADAAPSMADDLVSALVNLGFPRAAAEKDVQKQLGESPDVSFEDALKNVLRKLAG